MSSVIYLATVLISIHVARSYILLTANLDDFHNIGKQIASSNVGSQIHQILRRASAIFNETVNKPHQRSENNQDRSLEVWVPGKSDRESDQENLSEKDEAYLKAKHENMSERRAGEEDVVTLGKNASYYLQSLKKIFESV